MNDITDLLNLKDPNISIASVRIFDGIKEITLQRSISPHFCPYCQSRMHSKGIRKRTVNHPVLQDGFRLQLVLKQRRWKCTNPACSYEMNEEFSFVSPGKRNTNLTDILILEAFRDISNTAAAIARRYHVSDTYALKVFDRYVDMKRLPLGEILSVDEIHLEIPRECDYALILMDFVSHQLIDVIPSRRQKVTEPYFASIPLEERRCVRYLVCDMYNPYLAFVDKYFPNAEAIVDSFHVVQYLETQILKFLNTLQKQIKDRDEKTKQQKEQEAGRKLRIPQSDEAYLLKKHKWIMLTNRENINYTAKPRWDKHFRYYMDTYAYEEHFFKIDPALQEIRELKEKYVQFNARYAGNEQQAAMELDHLIAQYQQCKYTLFHDFARLLKKYRNPIIRSFKLIETCHGTVRPSNGPIESLNRKPKDMKRSARGYGNFEHARNRLLFAARFQAPILAIPREDSAFKKNTGTKRGPYNKRKQTD